MILYDRLWKTMKEKNISQYRLIHKYNVSSGQISRLKQNAYVNTHTLDMLCSILDCEIEDIIEFQYDPAQNMEFGISPDLQQTSEEMRGMDEETE